MLALILANCIPLAGVLWWGWETSDIMLLFWSENIIIGVMNVLRMTLWGVIRKQLHAALPLAAFFTVHYGIFTAVHGVFVVSFFADGKSAGAEHTLQAWLHTDGTFLAILGLTVSHFFSLISNFLGKGEVHRVELNSLMGAPYGRIVVLHLTIIFGAFLILKFHEALWALVLLVALKTAVDLLAHIKEHRKWGKKPVSA